MAAPNKLDILIVGGSGFVSGTLATTALSKGHQVWTVTRGQRSVPQGVHSLIADRKNAEQFAEVIDKTNQQWDLVVDCIGYVPADTRQDLAVFSRRARHFVFISTDFVFDPTQRLFPQGENSEYYANEGYGGKKRLCELELINGDAGTMQWTVLRPCHIYGPGSLLGCLPLHGRDPDLLDKMRARQILHLVGGGHFLQQPIFAADLAELALSCYGKTSTYGAIFCCAGPDVVESHTYYRIVAEVLGVEVQIQELPVAQHVADHPQTAPFLCHRIYDLNKLSTAGLTVPATPLSKGLQHQVHSLLSE